MPNSPSHSANICVIGLGYVGLPLATVLASKGLSVYGIEKRETVVTGLKQGLTHIFEPGLDDMLQQVISDKNLIIAKNIPDELQQAPTDFIITVGTPIDEDKRCNLEMIRAATLEIANHLKDGDSITLRSTVRPGVTREICKPILDATNKAYKLAFCPERIVEGRALEELNTLPNVIGCLNSSDFPYFEALFQILSPEVSQASSIESAEVIKLINNITRDMYFALSNEVGLICEELALDASEVIELATVGYERTSMANIGLVGGPCLSKDVFLLNEAMENYKPTLGLHARDVNESLPHFGMKRLMEIWEARNAEKNEIKVGILGLAFKGIPATNDVRGSQVIDIVESLKKNHTITELVGYDPMVSCETAEGLSITLYNDPKACFDQTDLVIITTNHKEFEEYDFGALSSHMTKGGVIYDFWPQNYKNLRNINPNIAYLALGEGKLNTVEEAKAHDKA